MHWHQQWALMTSVLTVDQLTGLGWVYVSVVPLVRLTQRLTGGACFSGFKEKERIRVTVLLGRNLLD